MIILVFMVSGCQWAIYIQVSDLVRHTNIVTVTLRIGVLSLFRFDHALSRILFQVLDEPNSHRYRHPSANGRAKITFFGGCGRCNACTDSGTASGTSVGCVLS
jgi:hypothetical protein